jgi:lysyl endopeptidase
VHGERWQLAEGKERRAKGSEWRTFKSSTLFTIFEKVEFLTALMRKTIPGILGFSLFIGISLITQAQLSQGGKPLPVDTEIMKSVPVIDIPSVSVVQSVTASKITKSDRLKHLYFANNYEIKAGPGNAGKWINGTNGNKIWILGIRSGDAYSIGLILSKFILKGEARLFIYNDQKSCVIGAFTEANNLPSGILPVTHIPGKCIYLQLEIPAGQEDFGELIIGEAAMAYLPLFGGEPRYGLSDTCNIDINCPEGNDWQVLKRSVCRIVINGNKYCTGTLLNTANSNRQPYILTAAHCIGSQGEATKSIFYFNYESPTCNGPDGPTYHQISGSTLIATGDTLGESMNRDSLDFALVKLSKAPPDSFVPYYAGWNRSELPASRTTTVHHPMGDVKKISFDYDPPQTGYHVPKYYPEYVLYSHWRILRWDVATTEAGSSGCPLFDQNKRVVGLLTGGEANCVSSVNDYFTKFDYSWDYYSKSWKSLKTWLDPLNSGVIAINGLDWDASVNNIQTGQVTVYPVPGTGEYSIQFDRIPDNEGLFSIYTASGEVIQQGKIKQESFFSINMEKNSSGIYFIRLIFPDRILTARIIHIHQ